MLFEEYLSKGKTVVAFGYWDMRKIDFENDRNNEISVNWAFTLVGMFVLGSKLWDNIK